MQRQIHVMRVFSIVGKGEKIMWSGKPDKKCFILESIFNAMLPFALIWGIIDFSFMGVALSSKDESAMFIIPFFALHLMPVWIYLGGIFFAYRKYKNAEFVITNKGVYASSGIITKNFEFRPFTDLYMVNLHRGVIDQMLGVGDVSLTNNPDGFPIRYSRASFRGINICDIPDYEAVYHLVKDLQNSVYPDTMYPHDSIMSKKEKDKEGREKENL